MLSPTQLYAGIDTLDFALQGCLDFKALKLLKTAKEEALKIQSDHVINFGKKQVPVIISKSGRAGGYAFGLNTGKVGAHFLFKDSPHPNDWNIFVNISSAMLLEHGYHKTKGIILQSLKDFGATIGQESIHRIDFCSDFLMPEGFSPRAEQIIAPPNSKKTAYLEGKSIDDKSMFAFKGKNLQTLTVGSLPNLQVQIYDKRREAIIKKKFYWFKVWNINPKDKSKNVWRIEVRAGKKHLKGKWKISTFQDLEDSLGDVISAALERIRYLADNQDYETVNVTRAALHPLWSEAQRAAKKALFDKTSGLVAGAISKQLREQYRTHTEVNLIAYAQRIAVVMELTEQEIENNLPLLINKIIITEYKKNPESFLHKVAEKALKVRLI